MQRSPLKKEKSFGYTASSTIRLVGIHEYYHCIKYPVTQSVSLFLYLYHCVGEETTLIRRALLKI